MEAAVAAVHEQFGRAEIPHAFGGAFALAYYGAPRLTNDLDVNVFVPAQQSEVRFEWEGTPLHLFFSCDPLHEAMERSTRTVLFDGETIPIVSPEHLVIRKALLNRTKDWLDVEQIFVASSPLDLQEIESWLERMAGIDDPRLATLRRTIGELIRL